MNRIGPYEYEIYHRNSFDDEQRVENRKAIIALVLMGFFLLFVFGRGCYLDHQNFKNKVEGILLDKIRGTKESYEIRVHNGRLRIINEYYYDGLHNYDKLQTGDSLFKKPNSDMVHVFRKKEGEFVFVTTIDSTRW